MLKFKSTFNPIGHRDKSGQLILEKAKPKKTNITDCKSHWDNFNIDLYNKIISRKREQANL